MMKKCKLCKRRLSNLYGFCPKCWNKKTIKEQESIEFELDVKANRVQPNKLLGDFK